MFLSAAKLPEQQPVEEKQAVLQDKAAELPLVPLHQLVPLSGRGNKRQLSEQEKARQVPDVPMLLKEGDLAKTKQLYIALNHSLNKLVGFQWKDSKPTNVLRPVVLGERRETFVHPTLGDMKFVFNEEMKTSQWQSTKTIQFAQHVRIASVSDQGSSCFSLVSALAEFIAVMPIRDTSHKMHRVIELAMKGSTQTTELRREIGLCLKFDKAPWNTGRFGRKLRESILFYASSMSENDVLLAPLRQGLEDELSVPEGDFECLKRKLLAWGQHLGTHRSISTEFDMGRWDSFTDGVRILFRQTALCSCESNVESKSVSVWCHVSGSTRHLGLESARLASVCHRVLYGN